MLIVKPSCQFKIDYKKIYKSGQKDIKQLDDIIKKIAKRKQLPPKCQDHSLTGKFKGKRDCHVAGDWVLIYQITRETLYLIRTGNHSELFR